MGVAVGDEAPSFELAGYDPRDARRGTWSLSELRGRPVVLVFYPADGSPICTRQLSSYSKGIEGFAELDAEVLALSPQDVDSHAEFAEAHGLAFPLLADRDKAVARSYGVLGLLELYRRCTFVIDPDGRVSWVHRPLGPGLGFHTAEELVSAVAAALPT